MRRGRASSWLGTPSQAGGSTDYRPLLSAPITAFPDMVVTAQLCLSTDDYVAVDFVYRGTHQGTCLGVAPTGRSVIFNSTDIMRLRGDRLAEHGGTVDLHGLLQQLTA